MWRLVDSITVAQTLVAVVSEIVKKRRIMIYNLNLFRKDIFKKSMLRDFVQDDHFRIQPSVLMPLLKSKELYPHVLPSWDKILLLKWAAVLRSTLYDFPRKYGCLNWNNGLFHNLNLYSRHIFLKPKLSMKICEINFYFSG